ncbi:hypothetical protein BH20ACT11_BH20ACT11_11530 [soil metagenome]|jgi:hypothetical protein
MANKDTVNKGAEQFVEIVRDTADSYKAVIDHTVALQERNVRFAQGSVQSAAGELREQAESNRAFSGQLVERAEKQREAYRALAEQSADAYVDLVFAPLSYVKQGLQETKKAA